MEITDSTGRKRVFRSPEEKMAIIQRIDEAKAQGSTIGAACKQEGISRNLYGIWKMTRGERQKTVKGIKPPKYISLSRNHPPKKRRKSLPKVSHTQLAIPVENEPKMAHKPMVFAYGLSPEQFMEAIQRLT